MLCVIIGVSKSCELHPRAAWQCPWLCPEVNRDWKGNRIYKNMYGHGQCSEKISYQTEMNWCTPLSSVEMHTHSLQDHMHTACAVTNNVPFLLTSQASLPEWMQRAGVSMTWLLWRRQHHSSTISFPDLTGVRNMPEVSGHVMMHSGTALPHCWRQPLKQPLSQSVD